MIRLFIWTLFRFLITAVAIYIALTLLKKFIQFFQGSPPSSSHKPEQARPQKPKEEYKDVKDAQFVELPDDKANGQQDSQI